MKKSNVDQLFTIKQKKIEKYQEVEPTLYDLLKYESGVVDLTKDGETSAITIHKTFIQHFIDMGYRGYLINKALELWEEMTNEKRNK